MRHIIAIRKGLICIYRSGLIFYFALSMGCKDGGCARNKENKDETLSPLGQQILLVPKTSLAKSNATQQDNDLIEVDQTSPDGSDSLEPPIKKVKKLKKRVAKVGEGKQVVVFLHGMHRLSYDFDSMDTAVKKEFPHVATFPLTSVDKDPSKKGSLYISPSMGLLLMQQATLACQEIIKRVPPGSHVVMVAHSQGGLRAYAIIKEYFKRLKNKYGITIEKLITIATPWKGAPVFNRIKNPKQVMQEFKRIEKTLEAIRKNYSKDLLHIFFRFAPDLAEFSPEFYSKFLTAWGSLLPKKITPGIADLDLQSDFIRKYVALGLKDIDVPITAIAGVLTDFSKLFEPFPSSISPQALAELNATYADLIGGDPTCEHDMLLPVATQHAEGLAKKNFKCIKVYGACHGNKVGVSVKRGLSELNNKAVIEKVIESIEETFYELEEEEVIEKESGALSADYVVVKI